MRAIIKEVLGVEDGLKLLDVDARGSSGETKPTNASLNGKIIDGSTFIETDTGKAYFYNEEAADWLEV